MSRDDIPHEPTAAERGLARRARPKSGEVVNRRERRQRSPRDELPSEEDVERFADVTASCPNCGAELHDDVALCWSCGHALMDERPAKGFRAWVPLIALIVIGAIVVAFAGWALF